MREDRWSGVSSKSWKRRRGFVVEARDKQQFVNDGDGRGGGLQVVVTRHRPRQGPPRKGQAPNESDWSRPIR